MFLLWKFSNREYIRVTVQVHQSSHHLISSQTLQNAPYQGDKARFVPGGFTTHGLRRCLLRVAARRMELETPQRSTSGLGTSKENGGCADFSCHV